jgi:hypothetical protein
MQIYKHSEHENQNKKARRDEYVEDVGTVEQIEFPQFNTEQMFAKPLPNPWNNRVFSYKITNVYETLFPLINITFGKNYTFGEVVEDMNIPGFAKSINREFISAFKDITITREIMHDIHGISILLYYHIFKLGEHYIQTHDDMLFHIIKIYESEFSKIPIHPISEMVVAIGMIKTMIPKYITIGLRKFTKHINIFNNDTKLGLFAAITP